MSARREIPGRTLFDQRRAADPSASAWVTANAGSGKTHVLTQQVVRLLLAGAPPSKILCLTFTKAAAANMSLRIYRTLGAWTTLEDHALAAAIEELDGAPPDASTLAFARRLFAQTIETPGGLKIQTIHAFCESILHRFPFEANMPADFQVLDDEGRRALLERARAEALGEALQSRELSESLRALSDNFSASSFEKILAEAMALRSDLGRASRRETDKTFERELREALGLLPHETSQDVERRILEEGEIGDWNRIAAFLETGGANDVKLARRLREAACADQPRRLELYAGVFVTGEGEARKTIAGAGLRSRDPDLCARLEHERDRVFRLIDRRKAALAVERTGAIFAIVREIFARYEALKARRSQFDFDDLIERARRLMRRSEPSWVLYKLDSGIDHILVDEAQDTSQAQWDILQAMAEEFTAGAGARGAARSIFAVGDEKQSIYSFQGAAPRLFDSMRRLFGARHVDARKRFEFVTLNLSFRSAKGVLAAIDQVFADPLRRQGLSADDQAPPVHEAWKIDPPGRVEIWEPLEPAKTPEPSDWRLPLDAPDRSDPNQVLAGRIADLIKSWLSPESAQVVHDDAGPRPIAAKDVLILVRRRGVLFEALARALKDRRLPVAGADRLKLAEHIAVMDLMAAGRAALLGRDDLSLACVLKSPLVGLDDADLLALAPRRTESLWAALAQSADPRHQAARAQIAGWRLRAARPPFEFYSRILCAEGGRRKLIARLGPEAADAIDEFLSLALEDQRRRTPSLMTFLHRMESSDICVKRDMEAAGDSIRVMTIHAAKGLEAKIVILPDTCSAASGRHDPKLYLLETPKGVLPIYSPNRAGEPKILAAAREAARRRQEEEHRRLLYVAMTRAEERLIVAGAQGSAGRGANCWHDMIAEGLAPLLEPRPAPWDARERVLVFEQGGSPRPPAAVAIKNAAAEPELPSFLTRPAPNDRVAPSILRPSHLLPLDVMDPQGAARADALRVGVLAHDLLRRLPTTAPSTRESAAVRFLAERAPDLAEEARRSLVDEVLRTIALPALAPLFGPRSRAEVAAAGRARLPSGAEIEARGVIDRLAEVGEAIWIADFKTGAPRGSAARGPYAAQLALYQALAQRIWPGRRIRAFLVWTQAALIVELESEELEAALASLELTADAPTA